jgi:hypothetical protein
MGEYVGTRVYWGATDGWLSKQNIYREEIAMSIYLLDNSLKVDVFFDTEDCDFNDNICVRFTEECPEEEKLFWAGETNIYLTPDQARQLARVLLEAAEASASNAAKDVLTDE